MTGTPTPQHARDDDVSEDGTGEDAPGPGDELDQDGDVDIEDTVKTHARRLFRKLGVRDRAQAVAHGFRRGLVS